MGHRCCYYERVELESNQLVYIVNAVYGDFNMDVVKFYEDGRIFVYDFLTSRGLGGYYVTFPGERYYYSYSSYYIIVPNEPIWVRTDKMPSLWMANFAEIDYDLIIDVKPELKYFINKIRKHKINGSLFMRLLIHYKKNPNIESLVDLGYFKLALNKSLQRLSKKKVKEIIHFLKDNPKVNEFTQLKEILQCLKYDCTYEEYDILSRVNFDRKIFKVIDNSGVNYSFYFDYIQIAKIVGHDVEDEYWKYPSNLIEFHNRVMEEKRIYDDSKNEINNYKLKEVLKNIVKYNCNIDGYDVFVSSKYSEYDYVATELNQCLVRCNYIQRVIDQKEIIVFIWKDGYPVATAEVFYDKKIGQFYGNQSKQETLYPSKEVKDVLNKYLENLVLRKRKVNFEKVLMKLNNQCSCRMVGVN